MAHNRIFGKFLVFSKLGIFNRLEKLRYDSSIPAVSTKSLFINKL